jgi:hypothetical protein
MHVSRDIQPNDQIQLIFFVNKILIHVFYQISSCSYECDGPNLSITIHIFIFKWLVQENYFALRIDTVNATWKKRVLQDELCVNYRIKKGWKVLGSVTKKVDLSGR